MAYLVHSINNLFNVDNSGTGYFLGGVVSSGDIYMRGVLVATGTVIRPSDTGNFLTSANVGGVRSLNVAGSQFSGDVILTGAGNISITQSGQTVTISGNVSNTITGNGLAGRLTYWSSSSGIDETDIIFTAATHSTLTSASNSYVNIAHVRLPVLGSAIPTGTGTTNIIDHVSAYDLVLLRPTGNNPNNTILSINGGSIEGQHVLFEVVSGSCILPNTGNVRLVSDWVAYNSGYSLKLHWHDNFWREEYRNPPASGQLTGLLVSYVNTGSTGYYTGIFYPYLSNPSGYIISSQTGQFYASNNPSGYITSSALSPYVLSSSTGLYNSQFYSINGGQVSGAVSGWNITSNKYGIGAGIYTFYKNITTGATTNIFAIYNKYGATCLQSIVNATASGGFSNVKSHTIVSQSGSGLSPVVILNADVGPFNVSQNFGATYFTTGTTGLALSLSNNGTVAADFLVTVFLGGSFSPMNIVEF